MIEGRLVRLGCLFALLLACGGLLVAFAQLRNDLSFVVPRNPTPDVALLAERLQHGPGAGLVLVALSGAGREELARASHDLAATLRRSGDFHLVANGQLESHRRELEWLFAQRYLLNPQIESGDFTVEALRAGLERSLAALTTAYGSLTKQYLPADPTGRLQAVIKYWAGGTKQQQGTGVWLSADESKAFLLLWAKGEGFDLDRQEALLARVTASFAAVKGDGAVAMTLSGPSVFASAAKQTIHDDVQRLTIASVVLVVALLLLAFRSLSILSVILVPLGFGVCAGAIAVQLVFGEIHGITLAFGATLIGVAVDYPVHVVSHGAGGPGAGSTLPGVWRTLRLGVLTTVSAFLPFVLSNFPGLGQLGLFAVVGLLVAALVTRFLLPGVLPPKPLAPPGPAWRAFQRGFSRLRLLRLPLVLLALAGLLFLGLRDQGLWETDLRNLSPTPAALRDLDRELRHEMGAADVRFLLVLRGETPEAVLQRSEAMLPALAALRDSGAVTGYDLAARYLPSMSRQAERQGALPKRPALHGALEQAVEGLPFRDGLFQPFEADVARLAQQPAFTLEDFRQAGLGWRVDPLLFPQGDAWAGLIVPRGVRDPKALAEFVRSRAADDLSLLDLKTGSEDLVAAYRGEALTWLALGAFVALLVLILGQRSARRVSRVLLPVVLAVILTASTLALAGAAFSLFHLLSMLLVVGVGLDYALFFDRNAADLEASQRTLRANVLCSATTVTVFAVLALSHVPVLHGIGATVAVGALFSLVTAAVYAGPDTV